jgi:hypothetical protein
MAKKKKPNPQVAVQLLVSATVSQIAAPVDKKKVKSRGPNEVGQARYKEQAPILTDQAEWNRRWELAVSILKTGEVPGEKVPSKETADKPKEPTTKGEK